MKETPESTSDCHWTLKWLDSSKYHSTIKDSSNCSKNATSESKEVSSTHGLSNESMVDFLEQLLLYMDNQFEKYQKCSIKSKMPYLYSLSIAVICELENYQKELFNYEKKVENKDAYGIGLTNNSQFSYPLHLIGQLYHHTRTITRLRILSGGWSHSSHLHFSDGIVFSTFPALQYLYLQDVSEMDLKNLCSLCSQLRLLSVECVLIKSAASLLLSCNSIESNHQVFDSNLHSKVNCVLFSNSVFIKIQNLLIDNDI